MEIKVIFEDKSAGFVKDYLLEDQLRLGNVVAFKRSDGWVDVVRGPVRKRRRDYAGPERRHRSPITAFFG